MELPIKEQQNLKVLKNDSFRKFFESIIGAWLNSEKGCSYNPD